MQSVTPARSHRMGEGELFATCVVCRAEEVARWSRTSV